MNEMEQPVRGRIDEVHGMLVTLALPDGRRVRCRPPRERQMPIIGDWCEASYEGGNIWRIEVIEDRVRVFSRCLEHGVKPMASHVDRVVIVSAVAPPARAGLIDRMVISADPGIEIWLVLNKIDIAEGREAAQAELVDLVAAGARLFEVSVEDGTGLDVLRAALGEGTSMCVGHSGVGKSSLLNALLPGLTLATGVVNDTTSKGRHTTTVATLHPLGGSAWLVDTPGVRAWSLDGLPLEVIAQRFPGIGHLAATCHMTDCLHDEEPGCAVTTAREAGQVPADRYARYMDLQRSVVEDRSTKRSASFHDQRNRGTRR